MPGVPVVAPDPDLPTVTAPASRAAASFDPQAAARVEVARQVRAYAELGVLEALGLSEAPLLADLEPHVAAAEALATDGSWAWDAGDAVPFVVVLPGLASNAVVPAMRRATKLGVSVIPDDELVTYRPLAGLAEPAVPYLLEGIDTGAEFCGTPPEAALVTVTARGRMSLTLAEGIALTIVRPDMLRSNRCYSLAGSRTGTNQRVPAVWISERRAKLGWCWDRNPHTWLGLASAGACVVR